jgi:hypothetical protein
VFDGLHFGDRGHGAFKIVEADAAFGGELDTEKNRNPETQRLRVVARDIADFERVLRRRIMTLPGVGNIDANVLLSEERLPGPIG